MCTVLLPPGDNPIAVNKYIKSGRLNLLDPSGPVLCTGIAVPLRLTLDFKQLRIKYNPRKAV